MALVLVGGLVTLDLSLSIPHFLLELLLLVVEFVLKGKEMLIKRDSVTEKRFIATGLILLVHLAVLEEFDLLLHGGDLLVQIQDDIVMDSISLTISLLSSGKLTDFVRSLLQFGVTFEFLIDDRASVALVNIVIGGGKLDVSC